MTVSQKLYFVIACVLLPILAWAKVYTSEFAQVDRNDNQELQYALSYCSQSGETCVIPAHKQYHISTNLFMWGKGSLEGEGEDATIIFKPEQGPQALLQVGIRPKQPNNVAKGYEPMPAFSGRIEHIHFVIDPSLQRETLEKYQPLPGVFYPSRLIYFWRTEGAEIAHNDFQINNASYSATGSGNDAAIIDARFLIRRNIRIVDNRVDSLDYLWSLAHKSAAGNEGISLTLFDGAYIAHNSVSGVSDDAIAFHYGNNALIEQNIMDVTDGRLYSSSSRCVAILYNYILRRPLFKATGIHGDGMIVLAQEASGRPPTQHLVFGNRMLVPPGAKNTSGGVFAFSGRAITISQNYFYNASEESTPNGVKIGPEFQKNGFDLEALEKTFNSGLATPPLQGCFKDTPLQLPMGLSFLPIDGDNYYRQLKQTAFLPARNIAIRHNQLAPGGGYQATHIGFGTSGTWAALLGDTHSSDSCNQKTILGEHNCNSIEISDNELVSLPWQECVAVNFGNQPAGDEITAINSPCTTQQAVAERKKAPQAQGEKIFYGKNTLKNNSAAPLAPLPVPGLIDATEFSSPNNQEPAKACDPIKIGPTSTGRCSIDLAPNTERVYTIEVLEAGNYQLQVRAQNSQPTAILVTLDQSAHSLRLQADPTYQTLKLDNVPLTKGVHKLRLKILEGKISLKSLRLQLFRA